MKAQTKIFCDIFNSFAKSFDYHPSCGQPLQLPILSQTQLKMLLNNVKQQFTHEPIVLRLSTTTGPIIVVGDIHGHIFDLFRIINKYGKDANYLFLGDIVDRGEFSFETLTLVFLLKAMNPQNVHVIRGNHEFAYLCTQMGFMTEVNQMYPGSKVFSDYMNVLSMIPLCAIINEKIICLHGGIGPSFETVEQIESVQRPLELYDNQIINELLWSDPSPETKTFVSSPRGSGFLFGKEVLTKSLQRVNMDILVRGHNCVQEGVLVQFDGICITVFSASRYCDKQDNRAGVLIVKEEKEYEIETFPPLPYVRRKDTVFTNLQSVPQFHSHQPPPKKGTFSLRTLVNNPPPGESSVAKVLRGSSSNLLDK
ncbi:Serine/threonine-protein phosphatase PP1-beta [Tritrichomonas foetus]|uniref:Serine/threonine-protein phosphatase n=1 Tax=Tritrichomonas foetus TaxID=1144522 RepID=A0A1J4KW94_9EUKA|nr:Serine/threonine-protein phosphatase PP1-beta [Tritrichomonas foetus]|eukprot:OHT15507.1 Serine/threonine-protein phosphatase PP1-beta [Tritrichomonas foetus]